MPLTLALPQERNEDLFRALFGKSRGVPRHLLPINPQITDELDRALRCFAARHTFAARRTSTFRSDDGEWLSLGEWFATQPNTVQHWYAFFAYRKGGEGDREVIAARLNNQVLLAHGEDNACTGLQQQIMDFCWKAGIEVTFDTRGKLWAVARAVCRKENRSF